MAQRRETHLCRRRPPGPLDSLFEPSCRIPPLLRFGSLAEPWFLYSEPPSVLRAPLAVCPRVFCASSGRTETSRCDLYGGQRHTHPLYFSILAEYFEIEHRFQQIHAR